MKAYDHVVRDGLTEISEHVSETCKALYGLAETLLRIGTLWLQDPVGLTLLIVCAVLYILLDKRPLRYLLRPFVTWYEHMRIVTATKERMYYRNVSSFLEAKKTNSQRAIAGVYCLYNTKRRIYYVGQAVHLYDRVGQHCTGRGKGSVYVDMEKGHRFTIHLIPLHTTNDISLNALEKKFITYCNSFENGYNKTRGNHDTAIHDNVPTRKDVTR